MATAAVVRSCIISKTYTLYGVTCTNMHTPTHTPTHTHTTEKVLTYWL